MEIEPLRGQSKLVAKRLGLSVAVDQSGDTAVIDGHPAIDDRCVSDLSDTDSFSAKNRATN